MEEPAHGQEHHQEFQADGCCRCGRIRQRSYTQRCASKGIPCLIQEQNSYAGVTNKLLAKKAEKICVAYEGMERFFPADKIIMTGNPVRQNVLETTLTKEEARKQFGLDPDKKTILLVGGSSVQEPSTRACFSTSTS